MAYPEWCQIEIEPDDAQVDYDKYRELFKIMLKNIALIKPIKIQFFSRISQEIESIQIPATPVRRAEVSLLTIIELHQVIPGELRDKYTMENPYCALVQ